MPRKRESTLGEPSSVKRRKLADNISSESQSPAKNHLTEKEKAELVHWLDQADKKDGPIFTVTVPPKGSRKSIDITERPLILGDKIYLEARWTIKPMEKWQQMTKYKKFTVGNQTHSCGDCVLVKPDLGNDSGRDWKAQVHEVRAADEHHVFLRCTWLENPEELPQEALKSMPPYHGRLELVPGNKMDIIDALTVNGPLKVVHWDESNDDAELPGTGEHFWRQTYNYNTKSLSPLRLICECKQPHNPDHLIVKCSNPTCGIWLHASCLAQDTIRRKREEQGIKAESKTKSGKRARKSANKTNGTNDSADDNGARAEDDNTKAELVAPESAAPEMLVTDKRSGDDTKDAVYCLVCKELIE